MLRDKRLISNIISVRLRHEKQFRSVFFKQLKVTKNTDRNTTMNQCENSEQVTITTSSQQLNKSNVIKSLKEYNRSQINKILSIENDTAILDHDVGETTTTTHESDVPQLTEPAGIAKTVVCSVSLHVSLCVYLFI